MNKLAFRGLKATAVAALLTTGVVFTGTVGCNNDNTCDRCGEKTCGGDKSCGGTRSGVTNEEDPQRMHGADENR
jgi:hypothetical protein